MDNLEQTLKALNSIVKERVLARAVRKTRVLPEAVQFTGSTPPAEAIQESVKEPTTIQSMRFEGLRSLIGRLRRLWHKK